MKKKRKSPCHHRVRKHKRKGKKVNSYFRGHGIKFNPYRGPRGKSFNPYAGPKKGKGFDPYKGKATFNPYSNPYATKKKVEKIIPYYSRDDLENMFLGETEQEAKQQAEELGFTLEKEETKGEEGVKILEYIYVEGPQKDVKPKKWDLSKITTEPTPTLREVDLTINLLTDKVTNVFSYISPVIRK